MHSVPLLSFAARSASAPGARRRPAQRPRGARQAGMAWCVGAGLMLAWLGLAGCTTPTPPGPAGAEAAGLAPVASAAAAAEAATSAALAASEPQALTPAQQQALTRALAVAALRQAGGAAAQAPAFASVVNGATRSEGLIPIWRKGDKVWLEIPVDLIDQPLLFSVNISHSLGERGLHGSTLGPSWLASFVQVGSHQIQLQALNSNVVATGVPRQVALEQSFSRSLLASMPVASAPHPQSQAVLVDAAFLLADIASYGRALEATFRLPYAHDRGNSSIVQASAGADLSTVSATMHFAVPRLPVPPATPSATPPPTLPTTLPDARSLFVGTLYNFARLPAQTMTPRRADGRVGHFVDSVVDFSGDHAVRQRLHYINRWRLEKKEPQAALSEPVKPITFWLDKNIPLEYRATVTAGVLEWNQAFEKIGFKNAILVQQQPDDASWDTLDGNLASVRWYFGLDANSANAPHHSDPRSGEILGATVRIGDGWARLLRRQAVEQLQLSPEGDEPLAALAAPGGAGHADCRYAQDALTEARFAVESLAALGDIAPDSPQAEAFVQGMLKHVVMHEVGHALGLRHNFKASTVYTPSQLGDPAFTQAHGIASSVMDYSAVNLPLAGEPRAELYGRTIGPYDEWAIEYAYRPLAPADEAQALARIAARSTEPLLVFGDDGDAGGSGEGFDPLANRFDLGSDPLAYFERRLQLTRQLWRRAQQWQPRPDEGVLRQRNMLAVGFAQLRVAADLVGKYVGGLHTSREQPGTPGTPTRQASFVPVEAAQQRRALDFLTGGLFSADSFRFDPRFLANLAPDYVESEPRAPVSIPVEVLRVQDAALNRLLSAGTARRLLDLPLYRGSPPPRDEVSLAEVYGRLQDAIWSELRSGGDIDPLRRNLQREHLRRVQAALLRSATPLPADALSLLRLHARRLQTELQRAAAGTGRPTVTRAHLQDSLEALTEALRASMLRS